MWVNTLTHIPVGKAYLCIDVYCNLITSLVYNVTDIVE